MQFYTELSALKNIAGTNLNDSILLTAGWPNNTIFCFNLYPSYIPLYHPPIKHTHSLSNARMKSHSHRQKAPAVVMSLLLSHYGVNHVVAEQHKTPEGSLSLQRSGTCSWFFSFYYCNTKSLVEYVDIVKTNMTRFGHQFIFIFTNRCFPLGIKRKQECGKLLIGNKNPHKFRSRQFLSPVRGDEKPCSAVIVVINASCIILRTTSQSSFIPERTWSMPAPLEQRRHVKLSSYKLFDWLKFYMIHAPFFQEFTFFLSFLSPLFF